MLELNPYPRHTHASSIFDMISRGNPVFIIQPEENRYAPPTPSSLYRWWSISLGKDRILLPVESSGILPTRLLELASPITILEDFELSNSRADSQALAPQHYWSRFDLIFL